MAALALQTWLIFGAIDTVSPGVRAAAIWCTQLVVAGAVVRNLRSPWHAGMAVLVAGLVMNLAVMAANGGLMPVSPQTLVRGGHGRVLERVSVGQPLPRSKDVILHVEDMSLPLLVDRIVIPGWRGSLSFGDVVIAIGGFLVLHAAVAAAVDGSRN